MTDQRPLVAGHPFFADLAEDLRDRLVGWSRLVEFPADAFILREGDPADNLIAIISGRVAVGLREPGRQFHAIETLGRGDLLGWSWLFAPYRWTFDAVALKPVTAIAIDARGIRQLVQSDPTASAAIYRAIATIMADRLHAARLRLLDIYRGPDVH